MENHYKTILSELMQEFGEFGQILTEKLNGVISDTELSTIKSLLATRNIGELLQHYPLPASENEQQKTVEEVLSVLVDMQENFQFHDIVRQTIERLLFAFAKREALMQRLVNSLDSVEALESLLVEMKKNNLEYLHQDGQHVSSISTHEPLAQVFEAFN